MAHDTALRGTVLDQAALHGVLRQVGVWASIWWSCALQPRRAWLPGHFSQLTGCVDAAGEYELSATEAREIIDHQIDVMQNDWDDAADEARLTAAERRSLWGRQILNPFILYDR